MWEQKKVSSKENIWLAFMKMWKPLLEEPSKMGIYTDTTEKTECCDAETSIFHASMVQFFKLPFLPKINTVYDKVCLKDFVSNLRFSTQYLISMIRKVINEPVLFVAFFERLS